MLRLLSIAIACLLLPHPANCWWENGHRMVARIAAAHLSPPARIRIARILDVENTDQAIADALAAGSTWADEVKTDTHTGAWHYVDLTLQDSKTDIIARCKDNNCVSGRIRLFTVQLTAQKSDGRWSELDALRFLVHLVGDAHQPLHAISDQDLGGNCEQLTPPLGQAKNLHALWDGEIVNAMDADAGQLRANLEGYIARLDPATVKAWSSGTVDDWVWESHQLAQSNIYGRLHIPVEPVAFPNGCKDAPVEITNFKPVVDGLYIDDMKPVVRDQLSKAGLRLARVLNEAL